MVRLFPARANTKQEFDLKLKPLEIKKQEFRRSMRGYDIDEVSSFLEMVAGNYEEIQRELNKLRGNEAVIKKELENYKHVEKTLRSTLHNLQESSQQSKANSKKEAELIIREAEVKATELVEKAKNQVDRIRDEGRLLLTQKESLVKRLKHLLSSQMELIKMLETDDKEVVQKDSAEKISNTVDKSKNEKRKVSMGGIVQSKQKDGNEEQAGQQIDRIIENLEKQKHNK